MTVKLWKWLSFPVIALILVALILNRPTNEWPKQRQLLFKWDATDFRSADIWMAMIHGAGPLVEGVLCLTAILGVCLSWSLLAGLVASFMSGVVNQLQKYL